MLTLPPAAAAMSTAPWCWARCRSATVRRSTHFSCCPSMPAWQWELPSTRAPANRTTPCHALAAPPASPHAIFIPTHLFRRRVLLPPVRAAWRHGAAARVGPRAQQVGAGTLVVDASDCSFLLESPLQARQTSLRSTSGAAHANCPPSARMHSPTCCREDVAAGMFTPDPPNKQGLVAAYSFGPEDVDKTPGGKVRGAVHSMVCTGGGMAWCGMAWRGGA